MNAGQNSRDLVVASVLGKIIYKHKQISLLKQASKYSSNCYFN